ncbi:MAG: (2Fe-2S) ferredoxin domain-containing protein [Chthoniobacterales bacterium]
MALRERYLFVCTNRRAEGDEKGSCAARGGEAVQAAFKEKLKARGLAKVQARVCTASCLDQCALGVTILVEPDHFFYRRVTLADVDEIVEAIGHGGRVERLIATPAELAGGGQGTQAGDRLGWGIGPAGFEPATS